MKSKILHHCFHPLRLAGLGLLTLAAIARAQPGDYLMEKGDRLLITVWGFPEFTTSATVRDDGLISIPLAGDIQAAGLRREEFIAALKRQLSEYIQGEIRVTVSVLSSSLLQITVLGAVARPDNYSIPGETGLLDVIGVAGGTTAEANLARVQIFRKDKTQEAVTVDLEEHLERADVARLPLVRPGDVVFIPRQKNFLKDFGEYMGYVVVFFALVLLIEGGGN